MQDASRQLGFRARMNFGNASQVESAQTERAKPASDAINGGLSTLPHPESNRGAKRAGDAVASKSRRPLSWRRYALHRRLRRAGDHSYTGPNHRETR